MGKHKSKCLRKCKCKVKMHRPQSLRAVDAVKLPMNYRAIWLRTVLMPPGETRATAWNTGHPYLPGEPWATACGVGEPDCSQRRLNMHAWLKGFSVFSSVDDREHAKVRVVQQPSSTRTNKGLEHRANTTEEEPGFPRDLLRRESIPTPSAVALWACRRTTPSLVVNMLIKVSPFLLLSCHILHDNLVSPQKKIWRKKKSCFLFMFSKKPSRPEI